MSKTKTKAKKKTKPKRRAKSPVPASSKLNQRQEKLKRIVVATRGLVSVSGAAEELGVHRSTVWEDLRQIQTLGEPRDLDGWDEDEGIRAAIDFYETAISLLIGELKSIQEYEAAKTAEYTNRRTRGATRIFPIHNTTNLKLGVMNTIAIYRRDLDNFLITIGLIREAPKRILLEDGGIGNASSIEEIDEGIKEIRASIKALKVAQKKATS